MVEMMQSETHGFYVEFELRPKEDRNESMEKGYPVFVDEEIAVITMPGGSLVVDKPVTESLLREWEYGIQGKKPASPFALSAYKAFKEGREAPVNGMALKNWPGVTPAQLKMCASANVRTVEDLASANADAIRRIGMGSVALKQKAEAFLKAASSNKTSEEVAALKVEMEALKASIAKKDEQITVLMAKLDEEPAPKRRGRPPKEG